MPKIYRKNCEHCGRYYESCNKRFCSSECAKQYKRSDTTPRNRVCPSCLNTFIPIYKERHKKKFCSKQCSDAYRSKHGTTKKFYPRERTEARLYTRYSNINRRAFVNGWDCLTSKQFVSWYMSSVKTCAYCDIPSEVWSNLYKGHQNKYGLTIDRKDSSVGYIESNMVLACSHCNISKNNVFTHDEMREIAQKYIKPKWQFAISNLQTVTIGK